MNKRTQQRIQSLMPNGIPRWIRCYDDGTFADRYTVCYTGRSAPVRIPGCSTEYPYRGMSSQPFHPQGVGMFGFSKNQPCDTINPKKKGWNWPPALGRKCYLGRRISFSSLPPDCQKLVIQDYKAIWSIE